ncbi:MAG: hypothetical protein ACP6IU_02520 [Candidatus Asgardarchaeia archaeon]
MKGSFLKKIIWGIVSWAIIFFFLPTVILPWYVFVYEFIYLPQPGYINSISMYLFNSTVPFPYSLMLLSIISGSVTIIPYLLYEKIKNVNLFNGHAIPYTLLFISLLLFQVVRVIEFYLMGGHRWSLFCRYFFQQANSFLLIFLINALVWYLWLKLTFLLKFILN